MNKKNMPWIRRIEGADEGPVPNEGAEKQLDEDKTDWQAEAEKWKKFSRTWEDRAKENEEAKKRLAEIEDAGKSELEKLQAQLKADAERVAEAEKRAEAAEKARLRTDVALEFGISKEDRELFLTADDEATLKKQAEALSKRRGAENPNQGKGRGGNNKSAAEAWVDSLLGKK